jgi:hypothetical protein
MKKALATVACIFAGAAQAQVFVMPNKGGGEITLTARECVIKGKKFDQLFEAYTWTPSDAYTQACWTIVDGMVHVLYLESRNRMVYPIEAFKERK